MKQLEILNYHVVLSFKLLQGLALGKKDRVLRKKLLNLFEELAGVINEEVKGLSEEHKDNKEEFNKGYIKLLNTKITLDILPAKEADLPELANFLRELDTTMTSQDESAIEYLADVLEGKEKKDEQPVK